MSRSAATDGVATWGPSLVSPTWSWPRTISGTQASSDPSPMAEASSSGRRPGRPIHNPARVSATQKIAEAYSVYIATAPQRQNATQRPRLGRSARLSRDHVAPSSARSASMKPRARFE